MPLIQFHDLYLAQGDKPLLDHVDWQLEDNQRLCLMGRNGTGKSTMLKLLTLQIAPDSGSVRQQDGLRLGYLPQDPPTPDQQLVRDLLLDGQAEVRAALDAYQEIALSEQPDLDQMARLQTLLDSQDGWTLENRVEQLLTRFQLKGDMKMAELSGGWRRRVWLARVLLNNPQVLVLDEPTNHLDIAAIEWLEQMLLEFNGSIIFVTHDRSFADKVANAFVELDRGKLYPFDKPGLENFLAWRESVLAEQERANALFDKKLAEEEVWIRQGVKARRTRNEGRVRALKALRQERSERRQKIGSAQFDLAASERSGQLVFDMQQLFMGYEQPGLIQNFSSVVMRGDRIALIGPNGCGKSTLLKTLLGQLEPLSGSLKVGTKLEVAYFDQTRAQLDLEKSVLENLQHGSDQIEIGGKSRHILSYLQDFLFTPERARSPAKVLSGGERNRLLLARMFLKPANLLILDEPTNDLDVETLELLEARLSDWPGTLMLVSHDRAFVDALATQSWVFEGKGVLREYAGGFSDARLQGARLISEAPPWMAEIEEAKLAAKEAQAAKEASRAKPVAPIRVEPKAKSTLSYQERQELSKLTKQIEKLEASIAQYQQQISGSEFMALSYEHQQPLYQQLRDQEQQLEECMMRWMELEEKA